MAELAHFKNFAKLKDTSIEFNDITVLAGKPGTGKSYVMKFIYCLEEAVNKASVENYLASAEAEILKNKMNELNKLNFKEISENLRNNLILEVQVIMKRLEVLKEKFPYSNGTNDSIRDKMFENILEATFGRLTQISNNFIVQYENLTIKNKDDLLNVKIIDNGKKLLNSIFVETPLILEFKKFMNHEKGKTPYHIESLLNILDTDYSFTDEEQDKFIKSFREKSKMIIGGDIESSGDSFIFNREGDKNYDILNASSGIKSIGLLQYLVTNKALKKGSVLFWEEPEVHLHPSWQLKMVDLFVELMNAGVKIVFSTHSPFMGDYLNAISQKNNYRDRISFNLLKEENEEVKNYILKTDEDWNMIQDELLGSLEDIMWEYL